VGCPHQGAYLSNGDVTDIEDLTLNDLSHTASSSVTSTLSHAATHTAAAAVVKEMEPTATEPTATEPTATELTATEPTATEPTATVPTATELTATEPTATEPKAITAEQQADNNRDTRCGVGSGAAHQLSHRPPQQVAKKEEGDQIGGLLACPAHGYVFDLATGHCISETPRPCATARTYAVCLTSQNRVSFVSTSLLSTSLLSACL